MSNFKFWSALTPSLSPRRGSAVTASFGNGVLAALYRGTNAARNIRLADAFVVLPLLGERAGVRAVMILAASLFTFSASAADKSVSYYNDIVPIFKRSC